MRKLLLECNLAPGDIVMMTAAVRDLHHWYPRQFSVDVRTRCPELWEHNPYLTPLSDDDGEAEKIECSYPLIDRCNVTPYHCLHGFIEFLNERLGLAIKPTAFKGDIHLSAEEKAWYSQVHELTGEDTPFWLVASGGKYDITIKWWEPKRYQAVVDSFKGRIQFVQVGQYGHHHPKLDGVIDLRGKTNLRQLIRLVYHSQGIVCPVTSLMHLAAAVETRPRRPASRACVVVAGAREPAHWEAYPGHQFIHNNGFAACCSNGGCWRDRTVPLRDGDSRDLPGRLCTDVRNGLPHCMSLITPEEVVRRIEVYFRGGARKYLSQKQASASERATRVTARNRFEHQALNIHSAGLACDRFIKTLSACPANFQGRGILVCTSGPRSRERARLYIEHIRRLGCQLPVQLWSLDRKQTGVRPDRLGMELVEAGWRRKKGPARNAWHYQMAYALSYSRFREVLFLKDPTFPVVNPDELFNNPRFKSAGALFWPMTRPQPNPKARMIWRSCGLRQPREPQFEARQMMVDKQRCWSALRLTLWFNENSDFYYPFVSHPGEALHMAFRKTKQKYSICQEHVEP